MSAPALGENRLQFSIFDLVYILPAMTKTRCVLANSESISLNLDYLLPQE